jgi:hypothetical protein
MPRRLREALAAMFCRGAMALSGFVMFLRSGIVRVNYMGVSIHGNSPFLGPG